MASPKKFFFLITCSLAFIASYSSVMANPESKSKAFQGDWDMVETIVKAIKEPQIPAKDYNIVDFGATKGGKTNARPAIMAAIEKASKNGGGRVVIPAGLWLSNGPIHLKSRINLHVSEGATLLFGTNPDDYLPVVRTRWEGTELYSYSPMIYAYDVKDVAITGKGKIDGNEKSEFHVWHPKEKTSQLALRKMGIEDVPLKQRIFDKGHHLRPSLIQFFGAERVLLDGYTVAHSPFWVNHLIYTNQAIVRNLDVESHHPNNDGVDIDSSTYVLVENNKFRTGDDSVVVKSGRDLDGRKIAKPSEYVVVRNNDMGGKDGIALGSEMSGDIRHVFFDNNILRKGISAIRFKANLDRGGVVEHIRVRNMQVASFDNLFWFQLDYPGIIAGGFPSIYRDIVFENITVEKANNVLEVHSPKGYPLQDVLFKDITVKSGSSSFILDGIKNLQFENVVIEGKTIASPADN